ncbi:MAG: PhzF family phenazine biosynthesis protein [Saprospiraceae bacterium]|nr:PhzF family phenazine biosynthesis protein [Saprospiraceae bacterium]MCF8249210.1 PhzF family phenazine biosynthesis protein [Saprospiraceae bacterium]MCF8280183.1 PhzF family phenazine biosynthesis protein [Bacteroidales bacterium]MCF8311339.1 PhzF family phenazine biosynthesis protein [Saprospiraceae bacterium]MCF8440097.1 PhzF family phenazine biosynthesis protein [Saprospiraceae bacterium]
MKFLIYQVDAFTDQIFRGNPAAVVPLEDWLPDVTLQQIAAENNLAETAFFLKNEAEFHLRWFTPATEVDLCGHATVATAHVLWEHLDCGLDEITFHSRSGILGVKKQDDWYVLDFPTDKIAQVEVPEMAQIALGVKPLEVWKGREDYLLLVENQAVVENIDPDFRQLGKLKARGFIITAVGKEVDFVSRCFFPAFGIDEDPVTGSAHTTLTPFWANKLGKPELTARQISKRGGYLKCQFQGDRTHISGQAKTYLEGTIEI